MTPLLTFRDFAPGDEVAFRRLNEDWITRFFALEPKDHATLNHPRHYILEPGGRIFVACLGVEPIACCALVPIEAGVFEVAKMAVAEHHQGAGIGRGLLQHTIAEARRIGATRLYLETNHILISAVRLYESVGFRHLPPERLTPSPYARADIFMELPFSD